MHTHTLQAPQAFCPSPFFYYNPDPTGDNRQHGHFSPHPSRAVSMTVEEFVSGQPETYTALGVCPQRSPLKMPVQVMADHSSRMNPMAMMSSRLAAQKPSIVINAGAINQQALQSEVGVEDVYQMPSTPPLSVSGSTISSPPSTCGPFSATANDPVFYSQDQLEDIDQSCEDELKWKTLAVGEWFRGAASPVVPSPIPSNLVSVSACPSVSPSSLHSAVTQDIDFTSINPRLSVLGSPDPIFTSGCSPFEFPVLPTLFDGDDEEHKLILGNNPVDRKECALSIKTDSAELKTHGLPTFEGLSGFDSDEDFVSNLADLVAPSQDNGYYLPVKKQRTDINHIEDAPLSEIESDEPAWANHRAVCSLPSPPESASSRRGSEDSNAVMKVNRRMSARKAKSAVVGPEISELDSLDNSSTLSSLTSNPSSHGISGISYQQTSCESTPGSPSQAQSCSPEATTSVVAPSSVNRRGRKQSLTEDPSKTFVCDLCSRRFRRQEHLKRHYRSLHTQEKPFECNECGKKFSRSDNLAQHARTHGSGAIVMRIMDGAEFATDDQGEYMEDDMTHELGYALYETAHALAGSTTTESSVDGSLGRALSPSPSDDQNPRKKRKRVD